MTMGASRFSLAVTAATVVFILLPLVVTVAISVSDTPFVTFPPHGFTLAWYGKVVTDPDFLTSLRLSLSLAAGVTLGAVLFGVPAGMALRRCVFPGRGAAEGLLLSPLIFPVLITGLALLRLFSLWGSANAVVNLLIAHVLVTAPYVVRTVAASLALADPTLGVEFAAHREAGFGGGCRDQFDNYAIADEGLGHRPRTAPPVPVP